MVLWQSFGVVILLGHVVLPRVMQDRCLQIPAPHALGRRLPPHHSTQALWERASKQSTQYVTCDVVFEQL